MHRLGSITLVVFLFASHLDAAGAEIESLQATEEEGHISVRFLLSNASQRADIVSALQSGLPTGFTFEVELIRKRPNWFDDDVARAQIEIICTFNSLTQEYLLNYRRNRLLVKSEVFGDFHTLMRSMTSIAEERLFPTGNFKPQKLRVRVRASLTQGYLLHVVPWQETTPWKQVRVRTRSSR